MVSFGLGRGPESPQSPTLPVRPDSYLRPRVRGPRERPLWGGVTVGWAPFVSVVIVWGDQGPVDGSGYGTGRKESRLSERPDLKE